MDRRKIKRHKLNRKGVPLNISNIFSRLCSKHLSLIFISSLFLVLSFASIASAASVTIAGFDFEDEVKRNATDVNNFSYTADEGILANKNISEMRLAGASFATATSTVKYVTGAGPTGALGYAPNSKAWGLAGSAYWYVEFSTMNYKDIKIYSKQNGSNTGPRDFKVQWSTNGSEWTDVLGTNISVGNNWTSGVLTNISLPTNVENKENVYLRWITTSNTSVNGGTVGNTGTNRIDDITVTGSLLTYTVQYNTNGAISGAAPATQIKTHDVNLTISGNTGALTKTGYAFAGWNTQANGLGTAYEENDSYSTDTNMQLFAQWTPNTYTIKFQKNITNATGIMADQAFEYGTQQDLSLSQFTFFNHTFKNWNSKTDGTGTNYSDGQEISELTPINNASVTLYAQWDLKTSELWTQSQGPIVLYHIYGGGGNINGVYRNDFVVLKNIGLEPVHMDGWRIGYASSQGTTWSEFGPFEGLICPDGFFVIQADLGSNDTQPVLPYYHATLPLLTIDQQQFKLSLIDNNNTIVDFIGTGNADKFSGSGAAPATKNSGDKRNQESLIRNTDQSYSGNNNLDYTVQWPASLNYLENQTYTIFFDKNSGTSEANPQFIESITHGTSIGAIGTLPIPPVKRGYSFLSWNTASDGTGTLFDQETTVISSMEVYAQWSKVKKSKNKKTDNGNTNELVTLFIDKNNYLIDEQPYTMDVAPFINTSRTFVPVRFIAEAFDSIVDYEPKDGPVETVTIVTQGQATTITITINSNEIKVIENDVERIVISDVAAFIRNKRTWLPIRAIGEILGAEFDYGPQDSPVEWVNFQLK